MNEPSNIKSEAGEKQSSRAPNPTVSGRRVEVGTKAEDNNQQQMISLEE